MKYAPNIHHRKSIRLRGYDYSSAGMYFITPCVQNRICIFGEIQNGEIILNQFGQIEYDQWYLLPERFPNVDFDEFIVMPNHVHGIIILRNDGATLVVAQNETVDNDIRATVKVATNPTIGDIVGAYKSLVVHHCLEYIKPNCPEKRLGKLWQRNYWEHIIRTDNDYKRIADYIKNNLKKWNNDKLRL